jgi:hydrogenase maturation protease
MPCERSFLSTSGALMANTRIVVCGMGNTLCGDDGIGPAFIREAKGVGRKDDGNVLLMDCGKSPGLKLREIVALSPSVVIVVSAADMGRGAGTVQLLSGEEAKNALLSAHKVDCQMFMRYLGGTLPGGTEVFFVCVQPEKSSHGGVMSPSGRSALTLVRRMVDEILSEHGARL